MTPLVKKISASLLLALIISLLHLPATRDTVTQEWFSQLDHAAETYLEDGLEKTAWAFAAARTANAVISVLQSFEVQASAGIVVDAGVALSPGEALDPINDLVERFSWVMLASATSLGIQQFLMQVMPWFALRVLLTFALAVGLASLWMPGRIRARLKPVACRLAVAAIALRLLIPIAALADQYVYDTFLAQEYEQAAGQVTKLNTTMEEATGKTEDKSIIDQAMDFKEIMVKLGERTAEYAKHLLRLVIIFVVQAAVLPLTTLWLLVKLLSWLADIASTLATKDVRQRAL